MRIVKPYGTSRSHSQEGGALERFLYSNSFPTEPINVPDFAKTHATLVIAQWISIVDKIITRPHGDGKPSQDQWALRNALGQHAWNLIVDLDLLACPEGRRKRLERQWWSRIHPYGGETDLATPRNYRGRWYATFARDFDVTNFDGFVVARRIYDHLYQSELRIRHDAPPKRNGLIVSRAQSISNNVLRFKHTPNPLAPPWSHSDKTAYAAAGDIAQTLSATLAALEGQREAVLRHKCAALLQDHANQVFGDTAGLKAAQVSRSGSYVLHEAIRASYKRILGSDHRYLSKRLPSSLEDLFKLVERKYDNKQTNALIRLGKVIHYQATPQGNLSQTSNVLQNWSADVSESAYWTTSGQETIKRSEAFVRVWRGILSIASRTLTDWADPEGLVANDILGARELHQAILRIDSDSYDRKAKLLFGTRTPWFTETALDGKRDILRLALESIRRLRNSAFHFVGIGGFLSTLLDLPRFGSSSALDAVNTLWREDMKGRDWAVLASLKAANAEYILTPTQFNALAAAAQSTPVQLTNIPALRHVLDRVGAAWHAGTFQLNLPAASSGADSSVQHFQYIALKLLYERGFAEWLRSISSSLLSTYVERAISRTTAEARRITLDDKVNARVTGRFKVVEGDTVFLFFSRLQSALTSESRQTHGTRIERSQALKYLNSLLYDVIAQAFEEFLRIKKLLWLCGLSEKTVSRSKQFEISSYYVAPSVADPQPWQSVLYFLLHLVPVDDVNKLSHQIGRFLDWSELEPIVPLQLQEALDLYQVMHDAKFTGASEYFDASALSALYESHTLVPGVASRENDDHVEVESCRRGMRELFRFGDLKTTVAIFANHPVSALDIAELNASRSSIVTAQSRRAELHELWVKNGHRLSPALEQEYQDLVQSLAKFRHLSDHVTLLNHLRLHRLLMSILARLIDYAAQWERDIYFVVLATIYLTRSEPRQLFAPVRGRYPIETGQILLGLRNMTASSQASHTRSVIETLFEIVMPSVRGGRVNTRNNLMHFNCLHGRPAAIDLTDLVNQVRLLMSYDRKQKNAVSRSVIDMLDRSGLRLSWRFQDGLLSNPTIVSGEICHLRGQGVSEQISGARYVSMVQRLF